MKRAFVSIAIPAYNEEKRIKDCLTAVFEQDYPKNSYEVIVVNNDSTDKTAEIIKKNFPQVKLVKEKKHGVVFARIRGIEEAKGEIVAYTDADVILPKDWVSKLSKPYLDSKVAAVAGTSDFYPKNGWVKFCQHSINSFNLRFNTFPGHNMSVRKTSYYECGGFSPKVNFSEDFYLSVKIKKAGKVVVLPDNPVHASSRRFYVTLPEFFHDLLPYALKYSANILGIVLFDRPVFFNFKAVKEKTQAALNHLKS